MMTNREAREEMFAGEEDLSPEYFPEEPESCEMCGGVVGFLGTLGNLDHYQCRNCGIETSRPRIG